MTDIPELSVVLACARESAPAGPSLEALRIACRGTTAEVIVVYAGGLPLPATEGEGTLPALRTVAGAADALVPELWAQGAEAARGEVVAFTIPECRVPPTWAAALVAAVRGGAAGAGGGFALAEDADLVTRGTYFLRYSAYPPVSAPETRGEIAGDNAAYAGAALRRRRESLAAGFWEVEFHRLIRAEGARLIMTPGAVATFHGPVRLGALWRQRLRHGRRFGAWRVRELGHAPWRVVAAAPLVPAVLAARVLHRLRGRPALLRRALPALPVLLTLGTAWACGEALGALGAGRHET
jgi:hypothetical protein